ncbi:replication initiation protein [Metabacillus fastidiosus]|uniref:Replication initiation protein n=1 Tax=Metabacillus fastidiosus TaxID=1458 RepID=A0ABU6NWR8_9BACI|nr:replication initiation protein [Metabacillus fastidiosus]MED4400271.1 replication initiation protein [Metabacillus fastidiosus]
MPTSIDFPKQLTFDEEFVEEADLRPYYWVNQSNILINMKQNLSITERRIIFALVSLVQPDDTDFKTYTIQIKELANLIGVAEGSFYKRIEEAVDGLQSKQLIFEHGEGNKRIVDKITWVQRATYMHGQGIIRIKLSEDLAQYLLDLKTYTKYQLFNVLQLKSEYSWRIYELLKEREPWSKRIIKVSELREKLNIPDDKLTLMKNFKKVVLDKAQQEIEEKTDIRFDYEVHKKIGRRIDSFIFYIYKNTKNQLKQISPEAADYDIQQLLNLLITKKVRKDKAIEFVKKYHPRYIEDNLRYAMKMDVMENLAGYIVKAIEGNFAESEYKAEEAEASLYRLVIGNYESNISELTKRNLDGITEVYDYYEKLMLYEKPSTKEEINELVQQRELSLLKRIDQYQEYRREKNLPPLTLDDFEGTKFKHFFEKWELKNSLPF